MDNYERNGAKKAHKPTRSGARRQQPSAQPDASPVEAPVQELPKAVVDSPPAAVNAACPKQLDPVPEPAPCTTHEAPPELQTETTADQSESPQPVPLDAWQLEGVAVAGLAHWRRGLPCQDAIARRSHPRPILALSDGAGSAAMSHLGAEQLVAGLSRFVMSLDDTFDDWLDGANTPDDAMASLWSQRLLVHAAGLLEDLAERERRPVDDLRATALMAIVGRQYIFCWQVGDGAIVAQRNGELTAVSCGFKGEFANQTVFVDKAKPEEACYALLPTAEVTGLALMSDGGAERLVASNSGRIASRLGNWLTALAAGELRADQLAVAYHETPMWERTSLDDRGIVMAARVFTR